MLRVAGIRFSVCLQTDVQNEPRQNLEFRLPMHKALHGLYSHYSLDYG